MTAPLIQVEGICHAYPDGTVSLRGVSFSIGRGECVGVIGANGAGKSSLLLHLTGCLLPSEGTIRIDGTAVGKKTLETIRRTAGLVFQDPDDQLFLPTVRDDVSFGPRNLGLSPEEAESRALRALQQVGAERLLDRFTHRLSGGEKRAVSIASVLAMHPKVLLLDEPSAGLDPASRRSVVNVLSELPQTRLVASHDLDLIAETCDRILVLNGGRLVRDAPAREVFQDKELLGSCRLEQPLSMQHCPVCSAKRP